MALARCALKIRTKKKKQVLQLTARTYKTRLARYLSCPWVQIKSKISIQINLFNLAGRTMNYGPLNWPIIAHSSTDRYNKMQLRGHDIVLLYLIWKRKELTQTCYISKIRTHFLELDDESLSDCDGSLMPACLSCSSWSNQTNNKHFKFTQIMIAKGFVCKFTCFMTITVHCYSKIRM